MAEEIIEEGLEAPTSNSMAAFSSEMEQLSESLNLLYIANNAGGRRIFAEKWPKVADYLFGRELIAFDTDGINGDEDRERRSELEEEADMKRVELKQTIVELIVNSVDAGSLQFEYVGGVIDKYGAGVSQCLYDGAVIERVRPGVLALAEDTGESESQGENISAAVVPVLEQSSDVEQMQDIEGTQQELQPEQEGLPVITEQDVPIEAAGEGRLSVEEKDILSNKISNAPVLAEEEIAQGAVEQEDVSQELSQEGFVQEPELVSDEFVQLAENVNVESESESEAESVPFIDETLSVNEQVGVSEQVFEGDSTLEAVVSEGEVSQQNQDYVYDQSDAVESVEVFESTEVLAVSQLNIGEETVSSSQDIQSLESDVDNSLESLTPEISGVSEEQEEEQYADEEESQDFRPLELLNLQEAMLAQKLPDMEEMFREGMLQGEDFLAAQTEQSSSPMLESVSSEIVESEVNQTFVPDENEIDTAFVSEQPELVRSEESFVETGIEKNDYVEAEVPDVVKYVAEEEEKQVRVDDALEQDSFEGEGGNGEF